MKLDKKSILIVIFLIISLILGYKQYFGGDSDYSRKVKQLEVENNLLINKIDSIDNVLAIKNNLLFEIKKKEATLLKDIDKMTIEIKESKEKANKSFGELMRLKRELFEIRKRIDELKKNPPNRTGNSLLNSIKIMTVK